MTKARAHFGCQTLNGVELEDGGGIGIEGTMWEARIMNGDFMSSILDSDHIVYSDITLAAFKDMGWYDVDYTYSQQLTWGKDAGCDFVNSGCINSNQPANYHFCATMQTVGTTSCDYKRVNKGICNLIDYGSDLES